MPLKKVGTNTNMYSWVTHTWNVIVGKCPHECDYCYVTAMTKRFPNMKSAYEGSPRMNEKDMNIKLGKNKKIFVAHTNDLFAKNVPDELIKEVLTNKFIGLVKGYTSHELRVEFPEIERRLPTLWTRSYFVSTHGHVSNAMMEKYVEEQKGM